MHEGICTGHESFYPDGTGREVTRPAMKGVTGVFSREMPEAYTWNQVAQP